jgi:PIN domain nuclease of toxin-antitoxin system
VKPRYVIDTHALVWFVLAPEKLGANARKAIANAARGEVSIPSAVIYELGRLIAEDDIELGGRRPSDVFGPTLDFHGVRPASMDAALKASVLGLPHGDPFDRLIVAEAVALNVPLITKDGNITDSGIVRVIW